LRHGEQMTTLNELSAVLIGDVEQEPLLATIVEHVVSVTGVSACAILLPDDDDQLVARAAVGPLPDLNIRDESALARFAYEQREAGGTGRGRGRIVGPSGRRAPSARAFVRRRADEVLYLPIATANRAVGVLRVAWPLNQGRFTPETRQLLATFANQAALAIERVRLIDQATQAAVLQRSDELKSALLSAVSHDLRTPLAAIKASATSLLQSDVEWSVEDTRDLLQAIDEETDRLTRIVGNLLDLSRIEAGVLRPERAWCDLGELIEETAGRLRAIVPSHPIQVSIGSDVPDAFIDYVEISQVLVNLLENAAKYSPAGAPIEISVERAGGQLVIAVADRGPGIPLGEEERIFEKFYRIASRRGAAGAGIGLSICRGIIEAHGGRIWAEQRPEGGAVLRFTLPIITQAGEDA
ncbi:MAG: ATP-binding protein, partial [Thermomicrobiales bacterium]